jgi:hypothetical protein
MAFQIDALQLPQPLRPTPVDWSPLNQIGDAVAANRRKQLVMDTLAGATDAKGNLDFERAGSLLAQQNLLEEGRPMLELAMRKTQLAQSAGQHEASLASQNLHYRNTEAQAAEDLRLRREQFTAAQEGLKVPPNFTRDPNVPGGFIPSPGGPADPAYQERVKAAADKTIQEQIREREKAVTDRGLDPKEPGMRQFILSGKLPREDQQLLTATDKKAILEADEHVQTNMGAIDSLKRAKELSVKALGGPLAGERGYATSLFGSESGKATTELTTEITQNSVSQLKAIFGGNPTEGERKILLDIQGSVNQPDAVRQEIYSRAIVLAERRLKFNQQRADELRGGTFYKPPATAGGKTPPKFSEGDTATNPQTGEKLMYRGGQWGPVQ